MSKSEGRPPEQSEGASPLDTFLEREILNAVKELSYGAVEITVHNHRVTEIKQIRRTRVDDLLRPAIAAAHPSLS